MMTVWNFASPQMPMTSGMFATFFSFIILDFNGLVLIFPLLFSTSHENKHTCTFMHKT